MTKTINRSLPYCQETEKAVLGSVLNHGQTIYIALSILSPADFSSKKHGEIFQAMKTLSQTKIEIDVLSVADVLRREGRLEEIGSMSYLEELESTMPTSQAITHHCLIVKEKAILRALVKIGDQLSRQAWEDTEEPAALIESVQNKLYEASLNLQNKGLEKQVCGPEEIAKIAVDTATGSLENPEKARGIETGFTQLDSIIRGLKDVNIISASTGVGKTALALNLAVKIGVNKKIPTLYLNHEMNLEELTLRLQGIISGVRIEEIQRGGYVDNRSFGKVMKASEIMQDGKLFLTGNEPKSLNTVISLIQKYKAQHGIKVVILDYLGEIEPTEEELRESEYLIYGQWVQRLKGVCTSLGINLVVLAQLNREGDKEVSKNKIGGSWKIAQKADVFIIMGVDKKRKYFLKLDKNRNGPAPREIGLIFDKETQRIHEAD